MNPDFTYENKLWQKGIQFVGGVDEVGRGCFAGPVVAACVGFSSGTAKPANVCIRDSKKMTQKMRETSSGWVKEEALKTGIGEASVEEINDMGIQKATFLAMQRAVINAGKSLQKRHQNAVIEHLLTDAFVIPDFENFTKDTQTAIVKGDALSFSIAAASILAKVTRDRMMDELAHESGFAHYQWESNKGYGTKAHREAILAHGITKHHRVQFVKTYLSKRKLYTVIGR